jgi:glucose-1-phosphate cytidylyltransferase
MRQNKVHVHHPHAEPWTITLVDTGLETMTGGRLLKIKDYLDGQSFCFTYGDGVSDVNITKLIESHKHHRRLSTVTAVQPPARFGALELDEDRVTRFVEKPKGDGVWINGGFFVLEPGIFDYLEGDQDIWEQRPLRMLAQQSQLSAYRHPGFWAAMDTLRDKTHLEELWASHRAPWKVWR